ncbi:MAG: hypothetical protein ACE37H_16415 [Phycisphaeraceae bacterium]
MSELNEGQWRHLVNMTDMLIRFCRLHEDVAYLQSLAYLRDTFANKKIDVAKQVAHQFPMTGMTSFIDPRPLIPLVGEDEAYCNLVFLTLSHAWVRLLTEWLFDGIHPNSPKALG